jgi:pimeloyl-ACP methyl ester carboxylesterase
MSRRKKIALTSGALVLVVTAAIVTAYAMEIRRLRARIVAGGTIAETAAGKIEYATTGVGEPLLSIHGAGGGYDQGLIIAAPLLGDGFRVIAPSRFGYLRTPIPSDTSPAAQADAHAALLDGLGVDRAVVVGTSAGAPSAVQLALRHPERVTALILLVPLGYAPEQKVRIDDTTANRAVLKVMEAGSDFVYWSLLHIAPSVVFRFVGVPPEVVEKAEPADREEAMRVLTSILPLSMRVAGIATDSSILLDDSWPLERIGVPTLIISSSDDLFHTQPAAEYAAAHIPGAKLVVYPTGGHLFVGRSADVRRTIAGFLERSLPGRFAAGAPRQDGVKKHYVE